MRIVSRLFAAAFNNSDSTTQNVYFIECGENGCHAREPHSVLSAMDDLEELYDWKQRHFDQTGHRVYFQYEVKREWTRIQSAFRNKSNQG